ncbi:coiled-coil domain-containing protein 134 isoform X1 [Rana temporaria]|uniref:coiled-coil domain-containing protein 134 isoform X1 n=1 Tax=Rana temporaria TaxID=8407 RepID=UPI001AACAE9B|nr:coiled-coil domain-containing protein 134 isoform X1 [Rana temporaria]XP_040215567.1 coiled-coil domain-containing protein 134 isoform X1 [Rana temporaria]
MEPLQILSFLLFVLLTLGECSDTNKQKKDTAFDIYKKLFEVKRKDQINALNNLIELNDVNQQYKIIDIMLKGLFKELEEQVVVRVPTKEIGGGFYSHIFVVRKPSGKFRLILNLKPLNVSVRYKRFRMDSIYSVKALHPPNCFMASIDLKDAYLHIPIAEDHQRFLRLAIDTGEEVLHLQFRALPFGLSSSPRIFTKVMAEVLAFLRLRGILIVAYLDDLLLFAPSPEQFSQGHSGKLRLAGKYRKIQPNPVTKGVLPGICLGFDRAKGLPSHRKNSKGGQGHAVSAGQRPDLHKEGHVRPGFADLHSSSSAVGGPSFPSSSTFHPEGLGPQSEVIGFPSLCPKSGQTVSLVVEKGSKLVPGPGVDSTSLQDGHNRCQQHRLGSTLGSPLGARHLGDSGRSEVLQLERIEGSFPGPCLIPERTSGAPCTSSHRQLLDSSLHQQAGGYKVLLPLAVGGIHSQVGRGQCPV